MRTNVLNDLSNVVKKGTILAGSAAAAVDSCAAGSTTLAEYPGNHPVITQLSPRNHPLLDAIWKHVAMIFAVLVMSVANVGMAWGAYTPTADEVIILNTVYDASKTTAGYSKHSAIAWGGTTSTNSKTAGDPNNGGAATSGNVNCYSVKGNGGGKNITVSITGCSKIIVYHENHSSRYVELRSESKSGTLIGKGSKSTYYTEVDLIPATTYTIFLHGTTGSDDQDFNVYAVKLIKASSCAAADLAAANITSNGDQIVGTGITFSKVGSPASGDTWYWQTSATGTDKTRNASSSYTTATTAGSYTMYLRAYNTAADCWGKAIGKTNTIISCPFDVYNGENVDKGKTTASGWTINSSSSMAKTNGSSNGYSYWYQAGSASNYVQFDGSIPLVSGDQIKIQWTHTNSSDKTLALTINGSSASLASGSTAKNSVLTEAIYNVTSATNVTSIKLNSSGSSGCIIYQVSIVKAACDDEPSCEAPSSVGITGTSSYLPGQNISLTAAATGGSGTPTTYQWYHRGVAIDGATSATYTKSNCTIDDAGNYTCKVTMGGSCSTTSPNFAVRVYSVKVWSNGGGSVIGNYPLTYQSSNNGRAVISTLSASTTYEFKVIDNVGGTSDSTIYYGNGGTIHHNTAIDPATWDFGSTTATNCKLVTGVETGDFTFDVDITHNGTGAGFYVTVNVAYPTKTIYLTPGVWNAEGAKFAIHYYDANGGTGWTDFLTANDCGMSAEIPVWDGVKMIAGRFNSTKASTGNWDDKWNQTNDITVSSYNSVVITGWDAGDYTYNSNFSTPTYTIGYAKGSVPTGGGSISGSKSNESKTCGVAFTLPSSAVFTATGYTQTGWAISDGGSQAYALGGTYTTNEDKTFYPVWTVNNYDLTWNLGGGTTTSAGTGIASGVSANTTSSIAYGTSLTAPTVTKTGYNFSIWDPAVAGTMPAANTTYTATWTAKTTTITIDANTANHGSTAPSPITATYGSALPSFTAASGVGDWSLTGYWTAATGGNKIINADGTLVASTSYADGSSLWNSEAATLTLYAQYEEECTPQTISKVVLTAVDAGTVSGYNENEYAGAAVIGGLKSTNTAEVDASHAGVETGYKLNDNGKGIVFATLAKGTFQVGDVIKVTITYPNDNHTFAAPVSSKEALELFYGTNKDDATSLTILTGVSAAGTYSYTLTAADVTAIGSKKGIGVFRHSDRKQNPFVYSVEIYGCRDWVIEEEGLVNWTMNLNTETWGAASTSTTDETNISSIATSRTDGGSGSTSSATAKVLMADAEVTTTASPTNYAAFTFTIASGKKVEPEKVTCKVFNVSSGNRTYKAQISDNNGHVYNSTNTLAVSTEATLTDATFNFASGGVLVGNVTVKVYAWKTSDSPTDFRMGPKIRFFGEVANAADYTVTHTLSNVTKSAGATSVKEGNNYTATYAGAGGYALPSTITVTIGGSPATAGTDYTWTQGTGVVTIPGNKVTGNIVITVTGVAPAPTYSVTHSLTNVTATSGATGAGAATEGVAYNAVFTASSGYVLPSTITVTIGGSTATAGTGYTWNSSTGAFQVPAAQVTGDIVVTIAGETAPASECVTINTFSTSSPTTISQSPFVRSNTATGDDTNTYLMWGQHAGSDFKGENSGAYMLLYYNTAIRIFGGTTSSDLFSNVTSVSFKWRYNSASSSTTTTLKVYVGSTQVGTAAGYSITGTKNDDFATISITELNQLSGYIQIVQSGGSGTGAHLLLDDIEICTSSLDACTTPALPDLSKQTVCEGSNGTSWNAAITNSGSLVSGETVAYSWVKKGSSTVLSSVATYQPTDVTEAMAGTYVVTATVSADGKASKSASKEVELAVNATVEISSVTQSPATVYAGNSVTLTATANVSATWQWYTCTNAEGDGESSIGSATSAAYAFTAPASAGTYYYKVKATGPCGGVATEVYALTVSAASAGCNNMVIFDGSTMSSHPSATATGSESNSGASWANVGTAETSSNCSYSCGGKSYTKGWKFVGGATTSTTKYIQIDIPSGYTGDLFMAGYITSSSRSMYIATTPTGSRVTTYAYLTPASTNVLETTSATLTAGTYYVCATDGFFIAELSVNICSTVTCTDPAVTASVSKSNVCAGSGEGVTFTASDAHADASYQWQKQNGSAWEDISGATAATYTITTVEASHAGKYRVVASHECDRISNELTLTVATTPVFGDLGGAREVETGGSLSITDVEATSATSYKWYKSANATYDSGSDEQVGTSKNLMLPVNETAGSTFYLFCVASNACTSMVSGAITVNVIAAVEKDCAVAASNGENFTTAKTSNVNSGTYNSQTELHMSSNNKYIYYVAASGYHFETATVNCCAGDATALTKAAYSYSTDGGETWTDADLPGAMTNQYTDHVVNLPANVNAFRVGRVLNGKGVGSNTLYVHQVCFTYVADCNATTITVSNASPTYDLAAGSDFTEPTCTVKQGSTALSPQPALRYSSFNEAIATVDPSTGEVDFTGTAGSVMIMASYDGDETYCESSATYTITVSCGSESAPKIVAGSGTNLSGCNAEVNLVVKDQNGNDFASGSYQWYRDGEEIDGANSATYTANRTGTYTVSHTGVCTQMSTNSAVVTSESFDPSVERLVPFQYYHANKDYTDQMKMRHLFAVTSGGDYEGKRYYMTATRNGAPLDITTSTAFSVRTSIDNRVDSVMIDLNKLKGKFNAGDEIVLTCAAIADCGTISAVTENIEIHVIDNTPTLALICSGTNKSAGTRKTSEMTVGGDFLTGYNKADLCEQTGNTSFDANTEWGLYTRLKENYIVTPVNGYAVFNKLNYEPFDILLLTDYPKASKSTEAALILDDMYELCDYRPMLSFKTHMVQPADKLDGRDSHWKKKGFTTLPEAITKGDGRLKMNIVCYAHPMFEEITEGAANDYDDESQIVYTMLSGPGHEGSKGMQGFHLAAAENFVTIGLVHYNATATDNYDGSGNVKWTPESDDEMLVAAAERQTNLEARFILFSLNCGAQSKLTAQGNTVVLKCLEYLLNDATIEGNVADCALTFDNKAGDHKWSNKANWAPKYSAIPGEYNSTRIAAPATVDMAHAKVMSVRIKEGGSIYIPAGSALDVKSTVRHKDVGSDVRPTDVDEIHIGSSASGNGTLIFNNNTGDTKARVDMYSNAKADAGLSAAASTWQYIGTPHTDVTNARSNYYGSWLYQYGSGTWEVIPNGGPLEAFRGYCVTHPDAPVVFSMEGTLAATTTQDIDVLAGYTVIANSWVAPIDINAITDDDMENISEKTIYFFNTGTDAEGDNGTGTEAGTYRTTPIHSASYVETWQIPSMQGFYISTTSAGTLHLDYDRHVRPTGSRSVVSNPMYAPRRAAAESEEPNVLKIFARGSRYQDKLVVLEREDFTRGYDSGWDGEAWGGGKFSPMVYVTGEGREDAVSAIPEFEGTVIAFKAGEDNEYHFDFIYDGEESLYLFDTENSTYTQIMTGESYYFSTDDKAPHSRFILTRRGPQIATGVEPTSDSSLRGRAKKLLIENKMYILLNGALYDATGKAVK